MEWLTFFADFLNRLRRYLVECRPPLVAQLVLFAGDLTSHNCPQLVILHPRPPSVANSDPAGGLNVDMRCNDGSALPGPGIPEQADISSWGTERVCPSGSALCGIRTKIFEGQTDNVSNLGLTDLMLQCCQLPSFISPPAPLPALDRSQSLFYFVPQEKGLIRRPCWGWKNMGESIFH